MALKPPIKWVPSPNFGYPDPGDHGRCGYRPLAIVHHLMEGTLTGTDSHFSNPASQASTTFGIGKTGEIHQYVDLADTAWGNGRTSNPDLSIPWLRHCCEAEINPNLVTISVEFEGAHPKDDDGNRIGFYAFTEAQIRAGIALDAWLCEQFEIEADHATIIGHFQLDSVTRAFCPGPHFPFDRFIAALQPPAKPSPTVKLPNGTILPGALPADTLLGPVRAIAEGLGFSVQWNQEAQQATIAKVQGGTPIPVYVNGGDGKTRGRTLRGTIRDGTTYVTIAGCEMPLRPAAVALGCAVEYVPKENGGPAVIVSSLNNTGAPSK